MIYHSKTVKVKLDDPAHSRDLLIYGAMFGDFLAISFSLVLAFWLRTHVHWELHFGEIRFSQYKQGAIVGVVLYLVLMQINRAYQKSVLLHPPFSLAVVLKTSGLWMLLFLAVTLGLEVQTGISRLFVLWTFLISLIIVSAWRLIFCKLLQKSHWASVLRDRVLVVGWSKEADLLAKKISRQQGHPYKVIGCTPSPHGKFWINPPKEIPVLGDYNSLRELLKAEQPDILIMADLDPVMGEIVALAQLCIKEHVQFKVIPSYFQIFSSGLHLESISGVPVVGVGVLPLDHLHNRILKRVVDIVGASVGLMLSFPLIAIFGFMIYRESPGPIFYTQVRSGQGRKVFRIYKLRSMRLDAEAKGAQWTTENDPRRLKIGEFMRKANIDEVPQFWNVLKGDMSLVGPRPERPELIEDFKEKIIHYNARHYAKPGITGYAQINGLRGNTDLEERVRYDLFYLENWTLWGDFYIMIKTFLTRKNAY